MNEAALLTLTRQSLMVALELSLPILIVGLVVGVLVSLFQAITQVQEMTLTFVPKILAVVAVVLVLGPWMLSVIVGFTTHLFGAVPSLLR